MSIGERVRLIRHTNEMSQIAFGKTIGKSQAEVSKIENGEYEPSAKTIRRICKTYNVSADWLLGIKLTEV